MDPIRNPYAPGAGSPPPELAGRDEVREKITVSLARLRAGRHAKSMMMVGLRGVGKTVLLDQMMKDAESTGVVAIRIEAQEGRSLPGILSPQLKVALLKLSRLEKAKDLAHRGLQALKGFASGMKLKFNDVEVGLDYKAEEGLADNGDLEGDLKMLLEEVGKAARAGDTLVAIFIDELQYVQEEQMAALISALHRCSQLQLPVTVVGAGLPQLRGHMGNAKSYAERLFDFPSIDALECMDAAEAIVKPAQQEEVDVNDDAVAMIVDQTKGYPYFLQEWGSQSWNIAAQSPITKADVEAASAITIAALDESFFLVRFDRLTPAEKRYLRAMAELGAGPHRSGDIAAQLGREVASLGPTRSSLITKGMVWSPSHGDTAFTVPLFDEFMKRIMPNEEWVHQEG